MTTPQKGRIFISYRRNDTSYAAGRIYDRLAAHFGEDAIFMDVEAIEGGLDFVNVLEEAVQSCDVLIALIGRRWIDSKDEGGNLRLENPEDFVRIEIATALHRDIRVIPVLVDGFHMPRSTELPENLKLFARRNALQVNHHSFNSDVHRLITHIESALKAAEESKILKAQTERAKREAAEKAAREKAEKEAAEKAAREKAKQEAAEKAAREKAEKEAAEKAAREKVEIEAAAMAAREKAEQDAAEKIAREKKEKEVAEKAAREKAEKVAAEKAAREKAEQEAAEQAAREKAEQEAKEKAVRAKAEREAVEKAQREKEKREAAEKAARERAARWAAQREAFASYLKKVFSSLQKPAAVKTILILGIVGILGIIGVFIWGALSPLADSGVVYFTSDRDGKVEIYKLSGGQTTRLTTTGGNAANWSPSAAAPDVVYFTSTRGGKAEIYKLSGGQSTRLTTTGGNASSWSPSAAEAGVVYFTSDRDGKAEIYKLSDGVTTRLTTTGGSANSWLTVLSQRLKGAISIYDY